MNKNGVLIYIYILDLNNNSNNSNIYKILTRVFKFKNRFNKKKIIFNLKCKVCIVDSHYAHRLIFHIITFKWGLLKYIYK